MNALNHLLSGFRLRGTLFHLGQFCENWCVDISGTGRAAFHLVSHGQCLLYSDQYPEGLRLSAGDLLIFPHDGRHRIGTVPGVDLDGTTLPMFVLGESIPGSTGLICGHFDLDRERYNPVVRALPELILLHTGTIAAAPIRALFEWIVAEAGSGLGGAAAVVERLSETLFLLVLRQHFLDDAASIGLAAALRDPGLHRALVAMHGRYQQDWDVATLAREAGMSRSLFAERFRALLAQAPLEYLTAWRMQLAGRWLAEGLSVPEVAERVGYRSEAAFAKAYKRVTGTGPGAWRRLQRVSA